MTQMLRTEGRLARRMSHVKFIDIWEICKVRSEERRKVEAEQRASQLPLGKGQQKQGRVSDEEWPDEPLVEKRLQGVEQGVLHAEPLEEMASKAECKDEEDHPVADRRGKSQLQETAKRSGGASACKRPRLRCGIHQGFPPGPDSRYLGAACQALLGEKRWQISAFLPSSGRRDQAGAPSWPTN